MFALKRRHACAREKDLLLSRNVWKQLRFTVVIGSEGDGQTGGRAAGSQKCEIQDIIVFEKCSFQDM